MSDVEMKPCPICGSVPACKGQDYTVLCHTCGLEGPSIDGFDWKDRPLEDAKDQRIAELEEVLNPDGLADLLVKMGADRCRLSADKDSGWINGLMKPMNGPDDDELMMVAHLDLEDSQFGPMLWNYALSVLKARSALAQGGQDNG